MHQGLLLLAFYFDCDVWYINDSLIVVTMLLGLPIVILYV